MRSRRAAAFDIHEALPTRSTPLVLVSSPIEYRSISLLRSWATTASDIAPASGSADDFHGTRFPKNSGCGRRSRRRCLYAGTQTRGRRFEDRPGESIDPRAESRPPRLAAREDDVLRERNG